jgi:hypothetical protein
MNKKNREYILWLCKRLVYRYNEDPKILLEIQKILEQNEQELFFCRQTHYSISKSIDVAVQNLQAIKNNYGASLITAKKQFTESQIQKTNEIFENFDIKSIG